MMEGNHDLSYDDASNTFQGVRFVLCGFDPDKEDEVRSKLLEGGGIDAVNYGPNCNYVIVDKLVYDDPVCIAARRDGKVLVTGLWVDHSFDIGMPVDPTSVMYWPMKDLNGIPGAESLVVCLTGYLRQDRDDIMNMVALMGANFSKPLVAHKVTHLICYKFEGEKYELAKKMKKIKLINHHWLEDCLKAWELLPEADYAKSGYELELEMEAEAKDSEEETEDIASIDLRKRIVVSPQNTRVGSKILHQSPLKQEVSKNTVYLSASENFANAGDTSKTKSTPAKERGYAKTSFSRGTHDKHHDKSTSSCARSPVKTSYNAPSDMPDGTTISEKVEHATTSASRNAKKSPDANLSKLSSKSRKSSLPLRSERIGNYGNPVASNACNPGLSDDFDILLEKHQGGDDSHGAKTPLKEPSLDLDEGLSKSLPSKRKSTASRGSSKSPKKTLETGLTPKTLKFPISGSSIGDVSPANVSGGFDMLSHRLLDRIVSDGVKTPPKANLLHLEEGQTGNMSSKRKTTVSRGIPRSPMSIHNPKTSTESGAATNMPISGSSIDGSRRLSGNISPMNITSRLWEEDLLSSKEALNTTISENKEEGQTGKLSSKRKMSVSRGTSRSPVSIHNPKTSIGSGAAKKVPISGSSTDGSCRFSGNISPMNITSRLREEDLLSSKEALNTTTSEDRQNCNDQALQHTPQGFEESNLDAGDPFRRTNTCTGGVEMQQGDPQSSDLNTSKVENRGNQSKPKKTKMFARKTLGSRPTIPKGSTVMRKGSINLQSERTNYSNGAVAMEVIDDAAISEKVAVVSPITDEDGPVDDETKAPDDKERNEFDLGSDIDDSAKVGASSLGKSVGCTKKQVNCETVQMREQSAKSVGIENNGEAETSSRGKKNKLPKSKSTGDDAGEGEITKSKKRPLTKSKTNKSRDSKGSTAKRKRPINLQSECTNHSNGAVVMEVTDDAAISEKVVVVSPITDEDGLVVVVVSPITDEDGLVDDETKAPDDKERNEFDLGSDIDDSAKVGASSSGKHVSRTKKQASRETVQMKQKSAKSVGVKNNGEAEKSSRGKKNELTESKSTGDDAGEGETSKGKKRPLIKLKTKKSMDSREEVKNDGSNSKLDEDKCVARNKETDVLAGKVTKRPSKKLKSSAEENEDKENEHATVRQQSASNDTEKVTSPLKNGLKVNNTDAENYKVKTEPAMFILSGHRLQRKDFQQVIKRLKGRVCRDSHNWSYQATHFIVPDPVRRTEKFFAAAASGCWILKTDYLTASNEAGRFLSEEPFEWHKKCLTEDGAINLQAPRKWRLLRERTGRGAFYGMRIIIYGECIAPPLDTLKRAIKAGDGTILATSPPYTRFLNSGVDFAIVSPVMPHQDVWIQEFLRHEVPCVVADYLVEYVCKPGYSLQRHVQYNTHAWAQKSLDNLTNRVEEVAVDPTTPEDHRDDDDVACRACESRDRGDEMLICGDESGRHGCGLGIHIDCLNPPLGFVPEEDWFCDECSRKREAKAVGRGSKKQGSKSRK